MHCFPQQRDSIGRKLLLLYCEVCLLVTEIGCWLPAFALQSPLFNCENIT